MAARKTTSPPTLGEYQELLRSSGLRSTAARIAVLRELEAATTPLSHADLVDALKDEGYDRVTLYRNLTDLTEVGLVVRTDLGDRVWRFELKRDASGGHHDPHPHFTCTDCGAVSCLPAKSVRLSPTKGLPKSVTDSAVDIQLRGLCDRCG
ncbi:zinc uptake regulation protein ZUR [Cystobacter fuscus]|uniref:Zinc uptake regulation protein ZUR n=1 Tax=Cystobacter fuscus TaxID=43 RepID=A0A250JKB4_9BACT|nr:transcriptional repressor [Cystobacter fuscus]ATB44068.1 zinc uptake regulation protein ZUR [Cystobacter fuscus]